MLTRLIYASEADSALTPASVQGLLEQARASNERRGLTGALAFDSTHFLQALEGSREQVSHVFGRIANDPRHRRVVLLEVVATDERHFHGWTMKFVPSDATHGGLYQRFSIESRFNPHQMTAPAALALLKAMAGPR